MLLEENLASDFNAKVDLEVRAGRFLIKTINRSSELKQAFQLRYQVFQVEMIGHAPGFGEDQDEYDAQADHLAVYDEKTQQMIATCRLNSSKFSKNFYSLQEFHCESLLQRKETKLEIGRVCVHKDFRKGVIIMLLWRALAEYMMKTDTQILFGCGSVMTEDAEQALLLYRYLEEDGKLRGHYDIAPTRKYRSEEFEKLLQREKKSLTLDERVQAANLLPSLCRSYFDIGCFTSGPPAFDRDFKCIDFLTILESRDLNPKLRQKMMGN